MKLIIAGSRHLEFNQCYKELLKLRQTSPWFMEATEIVCGEARGADEAGKSYGIFHMLPVVCFPPDWKQFGKAAGPIRNQQMAEYADALLLLWDGKSRGSQNMKDCMRKLDKRVSEVLFT